MRLAGTRPFRTVPLHVAGSLFLSAVIVLPSGCATLLRAPSALEKGAAPVDAKRGMNEALLRSDTCRSLRIEMDWLAGCRPREATVEALRQCAERWCKKPGGIEILLDEQLPQSAVPKAGATDELLVELHGRHGNRKPKDAATCYLYILYLNRRADRRTRACMLGWSDGRVSIVVFREQIDKQAFLFISAETIERQVLIHEFGHVMGLVTNPAHRVADSDHCCNPSCIMYSGVDLRSVLANFIPGLLGKLPAEFCDECKADLRGATGTGRAE